MFMRIIHNDVSKQTLSWVGQVVRASCVNREGPDMAEGWGDMAQESQRPEEPGIFSLLGYICFLL